MKNEETDFRDNVANQTVTGVLTDSMCKVNHAMMQKGANKMSDHDCTVACVKSGQKYVLTSGDKVYQIEKQNFAALRRTPAARLRRPER
jgi:hypothetical protein